jgi:hypothetical protein
MKGSYSMARDPEKVASPTLARVYLAVLLTLTAAIVGWPYLHQHFH